MIGRSWKLGNAAALRLWHHWSTISIEVVATALVRGGGVGAVAGQSTCGPPQCRISRRRRRRSATPPACARAAPYADRGARPAWSSALVMLLPGHSIGATGARRRPPRAGHAAGPAKASGFAAIVRRNRRWMPADCRLATGGCCAERPERTRCAQADSWRQRQPISAACPSPGFRAPAIAIGAPVLGW